MPENIILCPCCNKPILDLFYDNHKKYCWRLPDIVEG